MKSFSSLIGYLLVLAFIYFSVTQATNNPQLFLNMHGIVLVGGGLIIAALASFPWTVLRDSVKSVIKNMNVKARVNPQTAERVVQLSGLYQTKSKDLEIEIQKESHLFVKDAFNLLLEGINRATIHEILEKRIDEKRQDFSSEMNVMLTLSKYSPALGLAATVLGLVDLLGELKNADMAALGLGMALALSATFYGIILSNLVFAPLSELIGSGGEFEVKEDEMILNGVMAMMDGKNPIVVGEIMNSFLPQNSRVNYSDNLEKLSHSKSKASA